MLHESPECGEAAAKEGPGRKGVAILEGHIQQY